MRGRTASRRQRSRRRRGRFAVFVKRTAFDRRDLSMGSFATTRVADAATTTAPDGTRIRKLLRLDRGSMGHFELQPGETSIAVVHTTVEEIWLFVAGRGELWRRHGDDEDVAPVEAGACITLPVGTHFQLRALGDDVLAAVCATMPPWPGDLEAVRVAGKWPPTLAM